MSIVTPSPTSVYRYFDKSGLLLYVGITARGTRRQQEHNHDKAWWHYVSRQEVEHYPTRPQAIEREKQLIHRFRPPFNTQHNPDHQALRELYLATGDGIKVAPPTDLNALSPQDGFQAVNGKVPLIQLEAGNIAQFTFSEQFRPLLATHIVGRERVLLRAPKKRGVLTHIQLFTQPPTLIFTGECGGIPRMKTAHLHLKVRTQRPFSVRIHEAVGEVAA